MYSKNEILNFINQKPNTIKVSYVGNDGQLISMHNFNYVTEEDFMKILSYKEYMNLINSLELEIIRLEKKLNKLNK